MKINQNNKMQEQDCFEEMLEGTNLADADLLEIISEDSVCVVFKAQMTALEVAEVICALTTIASDLTVALSAACGFCDNCGEENPPICADCKGEAVCAELNGCKDTPADWVRHCDLCQSLLDKTEEIQIPDYLREDAGIPMNAKLTAFSDDEGEIVVAEADYKHDITDMPESVVAILAASGICIAELDELVMQEEIVYGK